jgi:hypothetical protein
MKNTYISVFFALLWGASAAQSAPPIMPFDAVRRGMVGEGRTVFEGTRVERFEVEILGTLPNVGPDQNLILGRCTGGPLGRTGVMSGMSGSPVMIDGKLIGAIAFTWPFAEDAIAGITPIEQMLEIVDYDRTRPARTAGEELDLERLELLFRPERIDAFFVARARRLFSTSGNVAPISIPISVAGMSVQALRPLFPDLERTGFLPLQAGSGGNSPAPSPPLEPGSAVGLKLVRGDLEMTATGTVTWVDGDRVLAFGHPLFGLGAVDLPMTGATVQALLPSLQMSAKVATPLSEIGALRQDRAAGVFGKLGAEPRMIPVRLRFIGTDGSEHSFSFDIADDPLLSPLLLYSSLTGVLSSKERAFGSATIRVSPGSVIKMGSGEDVALDNLFAGSTAFNYGTGLAAYILHLLMNNTWSQPEIAGVNLLLEYDEAPRTARVRRASLSRNRVLPGDTVTVTVVLHPYRGPDQTFTREIQIPKETPPGKLTLFIGGATATGQPEGADERVLPENLDQLVRLINQLRRNDRIYILATREDTGVLLGGSRLPNLPPSATHILSQSQNRGNLTLVDRRGVLEEAIDTDFAIGGATRLSLEVAPR